MKRFLCGWQISLLLILNIVDYSFCAMSQQQLMKSFDTMRNLCAPKFKISKETLDGLRKGVFVDDRELKCYMFCIAQMAGTVTKKNEISLEKTVKQIESMFQPDIRKVAVDAATFCKDVQKEYKDPCDRAYYVGKCNQQQYPDRFLFP